MIRFIAHGRYGLIAVQIRIVCWRWRARQLGQQMRPKLRHTQIPTTSLVNAGIHSPWSPSQPRLNSGRGHLHEPWLVYQFEFNTHWCTAFMAFITHPSVIFERCSLSCKKLFFANKQMNFFSQFLMINQLSPALT